jgi:hypothetical protein
MQKNVSKLQEMSIIIQAPALRANKEGVFFTTEEKSTLLNNTIIKYFLIIIIWSFCN